MDEIPVEEGVAAMKKATDSLKAKKKTRKRRRRDGGRETGK